MRNHIVFAKLHELVNPCREFVHPHDRLPNLHFRVFGRFDTKLMSQHEAADVALHLWVHVIIDHVVDDLQDLNYHDDHDDACEDRDRGMAATPFATKDLVQDSYEMREQDVV